MRDAEGRRRERIDDAGRLRELRLAALEPPPERPVRTKRQPPNLTFLRGLAAKNRDRAVKRVLEAFDAAA